MLRTGSAVISAGIVLLATAMGAQGASRYWLYATDFHTVGVMDEAVVQANAIDREADGNTKTLATFKVDVATAFAADLGGVNTWGDADGYANDAGAKITTGYGSYYGRGYNYFDSHGAYNGEKSKILYGVSQTKALQAVPTRCLEIWGSDNDPGVGVAVSGPSKGDGYTAVTGARVTPETNWWNGDPDSDNTRETLTFTGTVAGEDVKELGFVLLSQTSAQTVDVWVDYADATSSPVRTINVAAGATNDDVFVYFAAASSPIKALHWDADVSRPPIGDLGVILGAATPEPTWHPGDANKDGAVDLQDFGLLKENFGIEIGGGALWEQGDFNKDGGIDLQDFGILKDHFGHTTGTVPVTAVPEPATMSLLALAGVGLLRRRAR